MERLIYHKPVLEIIQQLEAARKGVFKPSPIFEKEMEVELSKELDSFHFEFDYTQQFDLHGKLELGAFEQPLPFELQGRDCCARRFFLSKHAPPFFSGSIGEIYSAGFSKDQKQYYRSVTPLSKPLDFHFHIEERFFKTDLAYKESRAGTLCIVDEDELVVSVVHDDTSRFYLVIESEKAQTFESFSKKKFAVTMAMAYLTGFLQGISPIALATIIPK